MTIQKTAETVTPFISSELNAMGLTTHQFRVLAHVSRLAGSSVCTASILRMSRHTGLHRNTVRNALKSLEDMNLIRKVAGGIRPVDASTLRVPAEIDESRLRLPEFRLLYYVIQKEDADAGCCSSFREMSRLTRLAHNLLKDAIDNLIADGWLTMETRTNSTEIGAWKGTLRILSSRYRPVPPQPVVTLRSAFKPVIAPFNLSTLFSKS